MNFRDALYASVDAFESLLENDPKLEASNYVDGSTFQFILACDLETADGLLNAQGAIADYFDRNGYDYTKTTAYSDVFNAILSASPDWVDPDIPYVQKHILPRAEGKTGKN